MRRPFVLVLVAALSTLGACTGAGDGDGDGAAGPTTTTTKPPPDAAEEQATLDPGELAVQMIGLDGSAVGIVVLRPSDAGTRVRADLQGLAPGFHGFHVHDVGLCEPAAPDGPFTTAGGHFVGEGTTHGNHDGDLPSLYVSEDGKADMSVALDTFTLEELATGDGAALMVHAGRDNFANIPDRYTATDAGAPGPDQMTNGTGDSGGRVACGVIAPTS